MLIPKKHYISRTMSMTEMNKKNLLKKFHAALKERFPTRASLGIHNNYCSNYIQK